MSDLIARLRLSQTGGIHYEAADALEAQARRIAELGKMLAVHRLAVDVDALKARIAELKAALKPFADVDVSDCADGHVCYFWGFGENAGKVSAAEVRAARAAYLGERE
jgi:hypothetical protein